MLTLKSVEDNTKKYRPVSLLSIDIEVINIKKQNPAPH